MDNVADVHLTLPEGLVVTLDRLARGRGVRRAHLLREAVVEYLNRSEAERLDHEMRDYADALAPHSQEFVQETEAHTLERLLAEVEW